MAQQQQQALHAAGGNMYMGGGGMAAIGGMHQMHQRLGYPRTNNQRPPNVSVGPPDGLGNSIAGRGAQQEWRHVLMQQGFQAQMRSQFNQQSHQGENPLAGVVALSNDRNVSSPRIQLRKSNPFERADIPRRIYIYSTLISGYAIFISTRKNARMGIRGRERELKCIYKKFIDSP